MPRIAHVLGSRFDPEFSEKLHDLAHRNAVEVVVVAVADLARRRLLATTDRGVEIAIALPRSERLYDGALLYLDDDRAVVVKAAGERWLRCEPVSTADAIELGYHAGNLHWRVRFDGNTLLIALEGRVEDYIARIEPMVSAGRIKASVIDDIDEASETDVRSSDHCHEHHSSLHHHRDGAGH